MVKTDYKANLLKVVDIIAQSTKPTPTNCDQFRDILFVFGSLYKFIEAHDTVDSFDRSTRYPIISWPASLNDDGFQSLYRKQALLNI